MAAAGNITFNANIGLNDPLQNLVVTQANQVVFGGADLKGLDPRSSGTVEFIQTAGNIDIGHTSAVGGIGFDAGPGAAHTLIIDATAANISLNGPVTLDSSLAAYTAGGNVLFTQAATIDSRAGQNNDLTLAAGSGNVTFEANLGATQPLGSLSVAVPTGGVFFGPTAQNQPLTINTAGQDITIAAPVTLNTSLVANTAGGNILFIQAATIDSRAGENNDLTLAAGSGSVTFEANLGATQPLGSLSVARCQRRSSWRQPRESAADHQHGRPRYHHRRSGNAQHRPCGQHHGRQHPLHPGGHDRQPYRREQRPHARRAAAA